MPSAILFAVESELPFNLGKLEEAIRERCRDEGESAAVEMSKVTEYRFNVLASDALSRDGLIAALSEIERETQAAVDRNKWLDLLEPAGE